MATCYRHPDRETGLACSVCDRPICVDCVTYAPVGLRCPDHSGKAQGVEKVTRGVKRATYEGGGALVTKALIGINVLIYLWGGLMAKTGTIVNPGISEIYTKGQLYGPQVADGEWYRLVSSTFLHANFLHIAMNMLVLWWIGAPLEQRLGRGKYAALYLVAGLGGSAGAILLSGCSPTVGASGAIFGLFGASLVLERQGVFVHGGSILGLLVFNLVLTFRPGISIGGHIGGLIAGAAAIFAISQFGRTSALYGRPGAVGIAALVGVGAVSVVVAVLAAPSFIDCGVRPF